VDLIQKSNGHGRLRKRKKKQLTKVVGVKKRDRFKGTAGSIFVTNRGK